MPAFVFKMKKQNRSSGFACHGEVLVWDPKGKELDYEAMAQEARAKKREKAAAKRDRRIGPRDGGGKK